MLSLSLAALGLATIGAYAKPTVRPVGRLEVYLSTPTDKVASVSDVRIVATVNNVGEEDLKVLRLGTVLDDDQHTRSFVVSKDGKEVPFTGTTVPVPMDHLSENDWVVIPAGKNVTAEYDGVSGLYDFSASGPGTFTFDPVSTFQVIGLDDNFETTSDATRINATIAHPISITFTDVSKRELELQKRREVSCGDNNKRSFISDSVDEATDMATQAILYMKAHGDGDPLYKDYFGRNVILDVMVNFNKIVNEEAFPGIMSCSDPSHSCTGNSVTYTQQSGDHMDIFFCDPFYGLVSSGSLCTGTSAESRSHRGGQTLRALAYALLPNTGKQVDGCSESRGLTDDKKINNLDTYMCFASEVYKRGGCK